STDGARWARRRGRLRQPFPGFRRGLLHYRSGTSRRWRLSGDVSPKPFGARRESAAATGVVAAACVDRANVAQRAILDRDDGGALSNASEARGRAAVRKRSAVAVGVC